MTPIREHAQLYFHLVRARVRSQWQYRVSFVLDSLGSFSLTFIDFVVVWTLFRHVPDLEGWSLPEVALLYGISGIGVAIADMVVGHIEDLHLDIRSGRFDVVLLRPASTLVQVAASDLALRRLGRVGQACAVLGYAVVAAEIEWNPLRVALVPVGVACATFVFVATFVLWASITFWTIGSSEAGNAFTYGGNTMTSYPLTVFGPWLRRMLAFVVPLAFVTYFPGLYLLDKEDPLGYPAWFSFAAPLVTALYCAITGFVWRAAVRHYRSTGS
jgi:ABC-2 type transport system permease protein